eukprot:Gregarina_sp_Pseudo_9__5044@NODE_52_length_4794_cov_43_386751_g49_i0_p1_GENE_NODE_52_length_4794_cov_43_386751_g49_i0NODE_52_length_4794_cov_43_386751_g49_i0_p1_ORF_typecomplete_len363_score70_29zfC2H2_aberr/PF17017_5/3_7e10zfC2H2_aberr/PF17017_5/0_011zfC2H2_aberr/PF17017_5/0_2zfC2H2_8/PF15909_5/1_5zfC2H2_8/PF15909_5/0_00037zfC2H2_8/PF15909_5/0_00014zfC2H2_8/PF15909_5/5_6e05zfC2H2_8/PF15909_5/0_0014zfC2H2_3rep/PF18868_1/0_46zfC2H2_3rep/PF18868_1/0_00025zfC2H2_3rep/PF18868_1/51zfC2H2_3rep/PF18868
MFVCAECPKSYNRRDHLVRHQRSAHAVSVGAVVHCTYAECPKWFDAQHKLNRHVRKVHLKPFSCALCGVSYGKVNRLRIHLCTSHGDRPMPELQPLFLATLQADQSTSELAQRLQEEMTDEPSGSFTEAVPDKDASLVCPFPKCRSPFQTYAQMKKHWRRHLRSYPCRLCPDLKPFTRYNDLCKHLKNSHGNYTCETAACGQTFARKRDFQRHRRETGHARENALIDDYPCPDCHKIFHSTSGLAAHKRRKHDPPELVSKFCCDLCDFVTDLKQSLNRHRKRKHEAPPPKQVRIRQEVKEETDERSFAPDVTSVPLEIEPETPVTETPSSETSIGETPSPIACRPLNPLTIGLIKDLSAVYS